MELGTANTDPNVAEALLRASFVATMLAQVAEATAEVDSLESQWYRALGSFLEDGLEPIRVDKTKDGIRVPIDIPRLKEAFRNVLDRNGLHKSRPHGKPGKVWDVKYVPKYPPTPRG